MGEPAGGGRVCVLVVAYNAERTLEPTLSRIPPDVRSRIDEIIVVDDASSDETVAAGIRWRAANPDLRTTVLRHEENRGYGGNQKAGYEIAIERGFDVVVMLHADGQYAPECMASLIDPILEGRADAVFGSRMLEPGAARRGGMPLYKLLGNRILTRAENRLLGTSLSEFHSGYRAYAVEALQRIPFRQNADGFDFDTQIIVQLVDAGLRIVEVPIPTYYGDEICYVNGLKYARDVMRDVVQYKIACAGFGTAPWVPTDTEYRLKDEPHSSHELILRLIGELPAGIKILDVGCSSGALGERLRALGNYVVGVDVDERPGVRDRLDDFVRADLDAGLPELTDSTFDLVVAADVIEHVRRPATLLRQMAAAAAPGGRLVVSTPNFGHWYPRIRTVTGTFDYDRRGILDETHLRFYTRRGLVRTFREANLHLEQLHYTGLPLGQVGLRGDASLVRRVDRAVVRARPTLFGYQFVAVLRPRNVATVRHDHA